MAELKSIRGHYEDDAAEVLAEATSMGFETVVIVGFKDGNIHIRRSAMVSRLVLLGAIEEMKHHILNN